MVKNRTLQQTLTFGSLTQTLIVSILLSSIPYISKSQCSSNKPTVLETFGAGSSQYNNKTPSSFGFTTTYKQENGNLPNAQTNDGEFSFINNISDYWNVWHGNVKDHTGDPGGYMMLINANETPGEFYNYEVSGLCIGITYEFSVWMANIDRLPGRIKPNVKFEIRDPSDNSLITNYITGDITYSPTFAWRRYSLSFTSTTDKVTLLLINDNPGGGGNDIVIDDIAFTPCTPNYKIDIDNEFCYGENMEFKNIRTGSAFANPDYLWQKKVSNIWTDIGLNASTLSINNATPADSGWYKLSVANKGNLGFPACQSEDSIYITVHPPLIPGKISSNQNICYGTSPSEFESLIDASGSNNIFSYTWEKSTDKTNWFPTNGYNASFTDLNLLTEETYYRRLVTTQCGDGYSDTVSVEITPSLDPGEIDTDQDLCYGKDPAIFNETKPASGGLIPYQYQWEYSDDNINWIPISGANATTYQSPDISNDRSFRRNIKDNKCSTTKGEYTNTVKLIYLRSKDPLVKDSTLCQQNQIMIPTAIGNDLLWYPSATSITGNVLVSPLDLSVPGTYTYFVTQTITGCVSPKSEFAIVVNPKPVLTSADDKICLGKSTELSTTVSNYTGSVTYDWLPTTGLAKSNADKTDANPSTTTTYTIIVIDSEGCKDTATSKLTVNPKPSITTGNQEICKGKDALIQTTVSNATGTVNYEWKPATGLSSTTDANVTASPLTTNIYTVVVTDSEGCKDSTTSTITVNLNPKLTGHDIEICEGLSETINTTVSDHTGSVTYLWSPATGLSTTNKASAIANPTASTIYTIYVEDSKGCKDSLKLNAKVNPKPILTVNNGTICEGSSVAINTGISNYTGNVTYSWIPINGIDNSTTSSVTATPTSTTTYTINAVDDAGCKDQITSTVTVNPKPIVNIKGGDICGGSSVTLNSEISNYTGPVSYQWSPSTGLSGTTTASVLATLTQTGTFTLTVTDVNLCEGSNSTIIGVTTKPIADILQNDTILCPNETLNLVAYNNPLEHYSFTWYYSKTKSPNDKISTLPAYSVDKSGYYFVEVRNEGFCPQLSNPVYVEIENLQVKATANKTELYNDEWLDLFAKGTGPILNYEWISTEGNSGNQTYSLQPSKDALYIVTAYGKKCIVKDEIYVKKFPPIIIPNGFSPNGDSKNDQWIITGIESYPNAIVKIFNRWGSIVYEYPNGYHEPWKGMSRTGLDLPSATYYYVIEVKDARKQTFNGSVTIMK
jgi:gliding motility-associated-like protein